MRVEKEKRKVSIVCIDKSAVTGFIHINPGQRVMDFINHKDEQFIVVTNAVFQSAGDIRAFKLYNEISKRKNTILLNKSSIKWVEELQK